MQFFHKPHDMHIKRAKRNRSTGIVIAALIVLIFALSVVKIRSGGTIEGFDHQPMTSKLSAN